MRPLSRIILHCSATRPDWLAAEGPLAQRAEIDRWHLARRFAGIGYHFLIGRNGAVIEGRPLARTGAHVRGHNTGSVGICLVGGLWPDGRDAAPDDRFADHFTPAQDLAARDLIARLRLAHGPLDLHGHNEFAARGCPGFRVARWAQASPAPA